MQVGFIQLFKLNAQAYIKVQNNRGYAPGLAWVRYNQKLAFHRGDMILRTILSILQMTHDPSLFLLGYTWMKCRDVINQLQP